MKQSIAMIALSLAALLLLAGCGGGTKTPATGGHSMTSASLTILWPERARLVPLAAESIVVRVTGPDAYADTQTVDRPAVGNTSVVTFPALPLGSLTVTATAYPQAGGQGVAQATGTVAQTAQDNVPFTLTVTMASTITRVTIDPGWPPLVSMDDTVHFAATAWNALGQVVLVPPTHAFTWTSDNPAIAPIDDNGLLTGKTLGSVKITATEKESGKSNIGYAGVLLRYAQQYTVQDMGQGGEWISINDVGQIVWDSYYYLRNTMDSRVLLWTPGVGIQNLSTRLGPNLTNEHTNLALDINNAGQVLGIHDNGTAMAFLWSPDGTVQDLFPTSGYGYVMALNDAGEVACSSSSKLSLWTPGSGVQTIWNAPANRECLPASINAAGQIAGCLYDDYDMSDMRAFLWTPGSGMRDLDAVPEMYASRALCVNDAGHVVGYGSKRIYWPVDSYQRFPFLWTPESGMLDFGASVGDLNPHMGICDSVALGINNAGQIVGNVLYLNGGHNRAFLWTPGSEPRFLPKLPGYAGTYATDINNTGQIVGYATNVPYDDDHGERRAVLWTPIN